MWTEIKMGNMNFFKAILVIWIIRNTYFIRATSNLKMVDLLDNLPLHKDRSSSGSIFLSDVLEGISTSGVCAWTSDDVTLYAGSGSLSASQDRNTGVVGDPGLDRDAL